MRVAARIAAAGALAASVALLHGCVGSDPIATGAGGAGGGGGAGTGGAAGGGAGGGGGTGAGGTGGGSGGAAGAGTGGASANGGSGGGGGGGAAGRDGGVADAPRDAVAAGGSGGGGAGGRGGAGGGAGASGADGGTGIGGPSQCTPGRYLICEDFEATAVGAVPTGWTQRGNAVVAADQAARGAHSLKIGRADSGERRIFRNAAALGSGHWGRIFYRVELPVPTVFVHSTLVALQGVGPVGGNEEVRVVDTVKMASGTHQFLYNVQPSGAEFGKGSAYNWRFDGMWHCAEWHIDNPTQSYHFYIDNAEVTQIAINNGAGRYAGSDIPPVFSAVRVGWNNYQVASPSGTGFVAWIDEVAMDTNRIGCAN